MMPTTIDNTIGHECWNGSAAASISMTLSIAAALNFCSAYYNNNPFKLTEIVEIVCRQKQSIEWPSPMCSAFGEAGLV